MASLHRLPSDRWRAKMRRSGHSVSRTFRLKQKAEAWARDQETRIDRGETPIGAEPVSRETLADLIVLHFADLHEPRRPIGRSKEAALLRIKDSFGSTMMISWRMAFGFANLQNSELDSGPTIKRGMTFSPHTEHGDDLPCFSADC